jgi:hypothetical protein
MTALSPPLANCKRSKRLSVRSCCSTDKNRICLEQVLTLDAAVLALTLTLALALALAVAVTVRSPAAAHAAPGGAALR